MKTKCLPKLRKYENKFYLLGVFTGMFLGFVLNLIVQVFDFEIFNKTQDYYNSFLLRKETGKHLLNFIEGKWSSAVGDVNLTIDINKTQDFIIMEIFDENQVKRKFKIVNIVSVDGLLGIVKMEICEVKRECLSYHEIIPIRINKIFGAKDTMTIVYDSRVSLCMERDDECIRAFKKTSANP